MFDLQALLDRAATLLRGQNWRLRWWQNYARVNAAALSELLGLLAAHAFELPPGMLAEAGSITARLASALPDSDPAALDVVAPTVAHERIL